MKQQMSPQDIPLHVPSELLEPISEVIRVGLQRATKLTPEQRRQVTTWWEVERDYISEELESNSGA